MKHIIIFVWASFLAGCSLLSPVKSVPDTTYVIDASPHPMVRKPSKIISVYVPETQTDTVYNTKKMAYSMQPYNVSYYAQHHWVATPGQMIQPLIVKTLQDTGYFHTVDPVPTGAHYDYIVATHLSKLRQLFLCDSTVVELTFRVEIINVEISQVVATKRYTIVVHSPFNSAYGEAVATNKAMYQLLNEMSNFVVNAL